MNAIEAGICSFDQSVKQIVEKDFVVDFKAKNSFTYSFARPCQYQQFNHRITQGGGIK